MTGPTSAIGQKIFREKYALPNESWRELCNRVACALKDSDEHYKEFRQLLLSMRFLPGGRILANAGAGRASATLLNCYCIEAPLDSFDSIMTSLANTGKTLRSGGGTGINFSKLRPRGSAIRGLGPGAVSSGPVQFAKLWDSLGSTVKAAGGRRGAQIAVLDVSHPDILDFVTAKNTPGQLTQFNISVLASDEFMKAVERDGQFDLVFEGHVHSTIRARELWETILRSTFDTGEPGILFKDTINRANPVGYCETLSSPNPCSEIALPDNGSCLLGNFVLPRYIVQDRALGGLSFDWNQLWQDIPVAYQASDNVIDSTFYPLYPQEREMVNKRRMGLGVTGLANAGEALGHPYGSPDFIEFSTRVVEFIRNRLYTCSIKRATERGAFPAFDLESHCETPYFASLPGKLQEEIAAKGIRNSHLMSIPPAGTTSLLADNCSSGLEPVFSKSLTRTILDLDGSSREEVITDYGYSQWGIEPKVAFDCSISDHLAVMTALTPLIDQQMAKTVNVPASMPWPEFEQVYLSAWHSGIKAVATFTTGGKRAGILEPTTCSIEGGCE